MGDNGGPEVRSDNGLLDTTMASEYTEELGIAQAKLQLRQVEDIAEQAGEMAVRALTDLVEKAVLVSSDPILYWG